MMKIGLKYLFIFVGWLLITLVIFSFSADVTNPLVSAVLTDIGVATLLLGIIFFSSWFLAFCTHFTLCFLKFLNLGTLFLHLSTGLKSLIIKKGKNNAVDSYRVVTINKSKKV